MNFQRLSINQNNLEKTDKATMEELTPEKEKQLVKSAIKILINNSIVKPEAVKTFTQGLLNPEIASEDWQSFLASEGIATEISKNIYNSNMLRGRFLRVIAIPSTMEEFLNWLNTPEARKQSYSNLALNFELDLGKHLSPEELEVIGWRLTKGINSILLQLLEKKLTPKQAYHLLTIANGIFNDLFTNLSKEIERIIPKISRRNKFFGLSDITTEKEIWQQLDNFYQSQPANLSYYKPFVELFTLLKQYKLAVYFTQLTTGKVPRKLYDQAALEQANLWKVPLTLTLPIVNPFTVGLALFLASFSIPLFNQIKYELLKSELAKPIPTATPTLTEIPPSPPKSVEPEVVKFETTRLAIQSLIKDNVIREKLITNKQISADEIDAQMLILVMLTLNNFKLQLNAIQYPNASQSEIQPWIDSLKNFQQQHQITPQPDGEITQNDLTYNTLKNMMFKNAEQLVFR